MIVNLCVIHRGRILSQLNLPIGASEVYFVSEALPFGKVGKLNFTLYLKLPFALGIASPDTIRCHP